LDHGAITVGGDLRVRVARSVAGSSARDFFEETDGQEIRLPIDLQLPPDLGHLRWHHAEVFKGRV
jgi:predicted restriction endonuclease